MSEHVAWHQLCLNLISMCQAHESQWTILLYFESLYGEVRATERLQVNENSFLESSGRLIGLQHTTSSRRHGVFVRWPGPRPGLELPRLGRASEPEKSQSSSPVLHFLILRVVSFAVEMQLSSPTVFGENSWLRLTF